MNNASGGELRVVFMGTPEFATGSLKTLVEAGIHVVAVVTTPDKPAGRGQELRESDVKKYAVSRGIPVLTPLKLKDETFLENLKALHAHLFVVVAFRMLPEVVWSMPPLGTINLHASLLPQYRGAAPINWAIINGETRTGVTTFFIERDIDTGNILLSEEVAILPNDTAGSLHDKLMLTGAGVLLKTVVAIGNRAFTTVSQNEMPALGRLNSAPKLFKTDCKINWNDDPERIYNFIRGLSPYPAAWTKFIDERQGTDFSVKIFETRFEKGIHSYACGTLISDQKTFAKVAVRGGFLFIHTLQLEGKRKLQTAEFLRGFKDIERYRAE